ncbi:MAG: tryptophan-rich sensory protein [Rhizobiales bacterium]|nr:tryptophan-rich sensory protein [Hyphomicrobiales bacterium]
MRNFLVLAAFVVGCLAVGSLGGLVTMTPVVEWYPTLAKPSWTPPSWVFGPVWTVLYVMMAVAAWLVWRAGEAKTALLLFFAQLLLNLAWSFLFFGARSPGLGLIEIVFLWLAVAATIFAFSFRSRIAAFLMVPYLMWVSFATALNAAIYMMN